MPSALLPGYTSELQKYLEVSTEKYHACLHSLDQGDVLRSPQATVRFHHLRFDGSGQPKFAELAKVLVDHVIQYCFSARRRGTAQTLDEISRLNREARGYFRKFAQSGEAGEILLYFLLEAVLGAPQMISKMELKTNPRMESHGSDGLHMKWHETDATLDLFFGEAKLETTVSSALSNMLKSLESFHRKGLLDHELGLVTSHYKHANERMRAEVLKLIDRQNPAGNFRVNHACLVGYDWHEYQKLGQISLNRLEAEFRRRYESDKARLSSLLKTRLGKVSNKRLRFEIFFLPFRTVQEFRDAFNEVL